MGRRQRPPSGKTLTFPASDYIMIFRMYGKKRYIETEGDTWAVFWRSVRANRPIERLWPTTNNSRGFPDCLFPRKRTWPRHACERPVRPAFEDTCQRLYRHKKNPSGYDERPAPRSKTEVFHRRPLLIPWSFCSGWPPREVEIPEPEDRATFRRKLPVPSLSGEWPDTPGPSGAPLPMPPERRNH